MCENAGGQEVEKIKGDPTKPFVSLGLFVREGCERGPLCSRLVRIFRGLGHYWLGSARMARLVTTPVIL